MKTKSIFVAIFIALVIAVGGTSIALLLNKDEPTGSQPVVSMQEQAESQQASVISFVAEAGKSVLDQLTAREDVAVIDDPQFGAYVDSINGVKSGDGGKYWIFYVDGQMAQVGAGEYITKGGESVEWRFE